MIHPETQTSPSAITDLISFNKVSIENGKLAPEYSIEEQVISFPGSEF